MSTLMVRERKVELDLLPVDVVMRDDVRSLLVRGGPEEGADLINAAASAFFGIAVGRGARLIDEKVGPPPVIFRERETGLLRLAYREVVVRFEPGVPEDVQEKVLDRNGFRILSRNPFVRDQVVAAHPELRDEYMGPELLELANGWSEMTEVVGASPNFVSEFHRDGAPDPHAQQWHLDMIRAGNAWSETTGDPTIRVAVLDDGVDVEHPNLSRNMHRNPDAGEPRDSVGRDFFIPDRNDDEHFNPRPKIFRYPFHKTAGNDNHGTPCAGLIAAAGTNGGAVGVAPSCRLLAVKIFHADFLASDAAVADAIRYAAINADVLSCSWSGGQGSLDIELAIEDAGTLGREGRGAPIFCAAGNGWGRPVAFPANHPDTIAVGAVDKNQRLSPYSNVGDELWVVAPSSGAPNSGAQDIFTTDVSYEQRGYNPRPKWDPAGLHTSDFGGTSAATPIAAGVGALVLSLYPNADRADVADILRQTTQQVGPGAAGGHDPGYGYGLVDAEAATAEARRRSSWR